MKYILNRKIKYYTKETFRLINIVAIALFIIIVAILLKYKLVCEVTVDGEKLGYITDKENFESSINDFINEEKENKLYTVIEKMPEYTLTFVGKQEETSDEEILAKIEESAQTTYKLYAVTIDGKQQATIANLEEAEDLVKELSEEYEKKANVKIALEEVITTDNETNVKEVKTAKTELTKQLDAKIPKTTYTFTSSSSSSISTKVESLNGVKLTVTPISGTITSRFGSRESIRSSGHTGLDIAAPKGTAIKVAASGTVTFAGYSGGYGNVVKVSHGNGIMTYYAHCSAIYVSSGQQVTAGDVIATVGSTGNSTGNHLHFEVVKNGVSLNPQNYLYK